MLKLALCGGSPPSSWQNCPDGFLAAAEFRQGAFASSSDLRQAATSFRALTVDGTVNTNKEGLTLITWTTLNSNGKIASAMSVLSQVEGDVDLAFSTDQALPLFYGRLLAWLALVASDGARVLQSALDRLVQTHCHGGPHKTHVGLCWWHAVLKVFITDYAAKCPADDELGRIAKAWLGLIVWESVSVVEAEVTFAELMAHVRAHPNGNKDVLATFLEDVWTSRRRLLACHRAGSPVGSLKGTYNEVYNYMVKNQIGKKGAGRLIVLADAVAAVSKTSVSSPHRTPAIFATLRVSHGPCQPRAVSATGRVSHGPCQPRAVPAPATLWPLDVAAVLSDRIFCSPCSKATLTTPPILLLPPLCHLCRPRSQRPSLTFFTRPTAPQPTTPQGSPAS